jgi:hypothetical protein
MTKFIDYTGQKFNRLTVVGQSKPYISPSGNKVTKWECVCDCGSVGVVVAGVKLKSGHTKSCGCYHKEMAKKAKTTHGDSSKRMYKIWAKMKERCSNKNNKDYVIYGGRGITYQPEWEDYESFKLDMLFGYSDNLELDRIDPDGNYTASNCRWVDESLQAYNKGLSKNNKSGVCGVYFDKLSGNWIAQISKNKTQVKLGCFENFDEAVSVRKKAELDYYGFNKEKTNETFNTTQN